MDTPKKLKKIVGKDIITVKTDDDDRAIEEIRLRYQIEARHDADGLHLEVANGGEFLPAFIKGFGTKILSVSLRHPSLDDVFIKLTGREMREERAGNGLSEAIHQRRMRH
jgi:ABC-2 type transport system ATP-binding protein